MSYSNLIKGEEGAIADDPIPLEQFDYEFWLHLQANSAHQSIDPHQEDGKPEQATFEFKDDNGFMKQNEFFSGLIRSESEEEILDDGPNEENENFAQIREVEQMNFDNIEIEQQIQEIPVKIDRRKTRNLNKARVLNQTKNIPKNYAKQIIKFMKTHRKTIQPVLSEENIHYEDLMSELSANKDKYNKISDLRYLWIEHEHSRALRVITQYFLRRYCYHWIFNSKIEKFGFPLKYRLRMLKGVQNPTQFYYLKEYD